MDDKDVPVEGQEVTPPQTEEAPNVVDEETSPAPADKELTEWATNKGYSADDLQDEKVQKAVKMAYNAEKFVGKTNQPAEPEEDVDIDKMIDDLLGDTPTPEVKTPEVIRGIDREKLPPDERAAFDAIVSEAKRQAKEEARSVIAPYESELRKRTYRQELDSLHKEFGDDVLRKAPQILSKVKDGSKLRDATISTLAEDLIKKSRQSGIATGKQMKAQEVSQKVEQQKKADSGVITDFNKLSLAEQREVLIKLQSSKQE